VSFTSVGKLSF